MSSKYAIVAIVVISAILLSGFARDPAQADETFDVKSVTFSPDPTVAGKAVEFTVELYDNTNVSGVYINICTDISCFPPDAITKGGDGVWTGSTNVISEAIEYHFNVGVNFENGTTLYTEDIYFTAISEGLEVKSLDHAPAKVVMGSEVDVYTELNSTVNVDLVQLFHCQGDVCFAPITMTKLDNGTYHARIGPFDTEEEVKYNVTTLFKDGEATWTQFTQDITFKPVKKSTDNGDDDDDNGGIIPAVGAVAVLAVLAGLAVGRRRKGKAE